MDTTSPTDPTEDPISLTPEPTKKPYGYSPERGPSRKALGKAKAQRNAETVDLSILDKPSKQYLGKTKADLKKRAIIAAHELIKGATTTNALITAGYSPSYAIAQHETIINNPQIRNSMNAILDKAGLTDDAIAAKIDTLCKAKKTLYFADKGIVTDHRVVEDRAIQRSSIELAAKIKGHLVDRSINLNVNVDATPISLQRYGRKQGKVSDDDT